MSRMNFPVGAKVFSEGDEGNDFFIISAGKAGVYQHGKKIAELVVGDYFGEAALLKKASRMATIQAEEALECLTLTRDLFISFFGVDSNVQFAKRQAVSAERYTDDGGQGVAGLNREKTQATKDVIEKAITSNELFKQLSPEQLSAIIDEMHRVDVKPGFVLIEQGKLGDNFYVVESGEFDISVCKTVGGPSIVVAKRGAGQSFGELALLYNAPRAATIKATKDCVVWAIDRVPFRRIMMKSGAKKLSEYEAMLTQVDNIRSLTAFERSKIAGALEEVAFRDKAVICKQGEPGDTFFIIKSGVVRCIKTGADGREESNITLEAGKYFGELALLVAGGTRQATCTAEGNVQCLCMGRKHFIDLMGPLDEMLKKGEEEYKSGAIAKSASEDAKVGSHWLNGKIDMKDLVTVGTLGKGSFGFVTLVKNKKDPSQTYALKGVAKAQIVELGQQEHIMSEKNAMCRFNSNFLVKLFATFKDNDALYFLLEPCLGGELFTLLRSRTSFNEKTAKFYAGCVVLAFEYMHTSDTLYRDLKPENLLVDKDGYIKVTDFGFAKVVKDRTWTLCGTPDYLAPEVVSGQGHGKGVDWWTLGVLIYEMLASYPPFYDEDPMKTYAKIMHGAPAYPKHFSADAKDLIGKLLHPKPTKRLGAIKGGADLIKSHPWFADLDWKKLENRQLPAPIILNIKNAEDLSNFEDYSHEGKHSFPKYVPKAGEEKWDADF